MAKIEARRPTISERSRDVQRAEAPQKAKAARSPAADTRVAEAEGPAAPQRTPTATTAREARVRAASDPRAQQLRQRAERRATEVAGDPTPTLEQAHQFTRARRTFQVGEPRGAAPGAGTTTSAALGGTAARSASTGATTAGETPSLSMTTGPDGTVVRATGGDDNIQVRDDGSGGLEIRNGGTTLNLNAIEARNLTIEAEAGDDRVYVDPAVTQGITINGGDGADTLTGGSGDDTIRGGTGADTIHAADGDDRVFGGEGNDTLDGGDGGDYIAGDAGDDNIVGGRGRDVLYGLDGEDRIGGGDGRDYIDGGAGDDQLMGGDGIDQVIGGRGDDDLRGGEGDDVLAGGEGTDAYNGDAGADTIFHQNGEWIANDTDDTRTEVDMSGPALGSSITITGDAEFDARVRSDLDALRSLPSGRQLLADVDATGQTTDIQETDTGNFAAFDPSTAYMEADNVTPGAGSDVRVGYNPSRIDIGPDAWNDRPPIVGLYHELVHAEDAGSGELLNGDDAVSGSPNLEHAAVGLDVDHDGDASTPRIHPNRNTENGFRSDLNLERRERY